MPLKWKKKTTFSRLVAGHLQPPTVETGFPNSLLDFYVWVRDRLRKDAEKKRRGSDSHSPSSSLSDSLTNPNNPSSVDSGFRETDEIVEVRVNNSSSDVRESDEMVEMIVGVHLHSSVLVASDHSGSDEIMEEGVDDVKVVNETEEETGGVIASSNPVMVAALKILIMVVLATETKSFTVGITLSAFMLFLLELVGKQFLAKLRSRPRRVSRKLLLESREPKPEYQVGTFQVVPQEIPPVKENLTPVICNQELQIEEERGDSKEQDIVEKELDEGRGEAVMVLRNKSFCRAKMKSAMKKLVPKKLRTSKKCSSDAKGKIPCGLKEEDKAQQDKGVKQQSQLLQKRSSLDKRKIPCRFKEEDVGRQDKDVKQQSQLSNSKGETFCGFKEEQEKVVEVKRQPLSLTLSTDRSDVEGFQRENQGDSGYLVLCLIVLVGLVGGRILALVLALFWCLLLKKTHTRRYVKLPIS